MRGHQGNMSRAGVLGEGNTSWECVKGVHRGSMSEEVIMKVCQGNASWERMEGHQENLSREGVVGVQCGNALSRKGVMFL